MDYSQSNALYDKRKDVNPVVKIEYTGDYQSDYESANKAAGLNQKTTPSGHVWHHVSDYDCDTNQGTMQLVEKKAHLGIPHNCGVSQYKKHTGKPYTHPGINRKKNK